MSVLVEKALILLISIFLASGAIIVLVTEVIPLLRQILETYVKGYLVFLGISGKSIPVHPEEVVACWNIWNS